MVKNERWDCSIYSKDELVLHTTAQYACGTRSYVCDYGSMRCYEDDYDEVDYDMELTFDEFAEWFEVPYELYEGQEDLTPEQINDILNALLDVYDYNIRRCAERIMERASEGYEDEMESRAADAAYDRYLARFDY